jgi:hypothetical protein
LANFSVRYKFAAPFPLYVQISLFFGSGEIIALL